MPIPKDPERARLWKERQRQSHLGKRLNQPGHKHSIKTKQLLSRLFSGINNPMYGKYHTEDACLKMSKTRKGRPAYFKGHHHTEHAKQLISQANKGKKYRLGKRLTDEQRLNVSNGTKVHALRGEDNPRWKGGISPENQRARYSFEMKEWRRKVFERDHYTCQKCGYSKGKILMAHHIKSFSKSPKLRLDISNGLTLCKPCHQLILVCHHDS